MPIHVRDLIEAAKVVEMSAAIAKRGEAEKKMWDFYLEWSKIVRAVVKDRRLLRLMGFLKTRKAKAADETATLPTDSPKPAIQPVPSPPALPASASPPAASSGSASVTNGASAVTNGIAPSATPSPQ